MTDRLQIIPAPAISNVEAEAALLGGLMLDNRLVDRCSDLVRAEDFVEPLFARMFGLIQRLVAEGKAANPVTLRPYLVDDVALRDLGGMAFLADLTGSGVAIIGARDFAAQVGELSQRRQFSESLELFSRRLESGDVALSEVAGDVETALAEVQRATGGSVSIAASAAVELALADMAEDRPPGVTCGIIPSLDRVIGAIRPGWFDVLAGRPGMGKTATALSYAHGAAERGHGVLFVSLEMRAADLGARLACDVAHAMGFPVPYELMTEGGSTFEQRLAIQRAANKLKDWPLWIEDLPSATLARLQAVVRRAARRFIARGQTLSLVIVDYLQLLRPNEREKDLYQAISAVSRGLKAIAKEEGVGVLALCQLSRSVEKRDDKRPRTDDLRDSGQIEQDSDVICFVLREEEYQFREQPREQGPAWDAWRLALDSVRGQIEFIVPKRRFGRPGHATGRFLGKYQAVRG